MKLRNKPYVAVAVAWVGFVALFSVAAGITRFVVLPPADYLLGHFITLPSSVAIRALRILVAGLLGVGTFFVTYKALNYCVAPFTGTNIKDWFVKLNEETIWRDSRS